MSAKDQEVKRLKDIAMNTQNVDTVLGVLDALAMYRNEGVNPIFEIMNSFDNETIKQ